MNEEYKVTLDRFAKGDLTLDRPVYDYSKDKDLAEVYDQFFIAMNQHLQERAKLLGWQPPVLVFIDMPTVNAFAKPSNNPKIIGINRGLIETMHALFDGQKQVFDLPEYAGIRDVLASTGDEPYMAMLKFVLTFCYQHEYTHLLQLSPGTPFTFEEKQLLPPPPADVPRLHAFEMDADHIAANRLGWMLTEHFKDEADNRLEGTSVDVTHLAAAALAGVFCMLVHFAQRYPAIYYGERNHPHPLVRLAFIAQYLPMVVKANVPDGIVLDEVEALTQALTMAEKILEPTYGDAVRGAADTFTSNEGEIRAYGNRIIDLALTIPTLSHHRPTEHF